MILFSASYSISDLQSFSKPFCNVLQLAFNYLEYFFIRCTVNLPLVPFDKHCPVSMKFQITLDHWLQSLTLTYLMLVSHAILPR